MPIATTTPHPHLPIPLGDLSVWQHTTREHPLLNRGKHDSLPQEADVVVIGSGMCGAVVAHTLLNHPSRPKSIVVLEAREICSGASGRNAGHCRPDAARGFNAFAALHGEEQSKKILASEDVVLNRVDAFIKKHSVSCEWQPRPTLDVCLSNEFKAYEDRALANLRAAGGNPDIHVLDGPAAKEECRTEMAVGAFKWPAATLNPAQLTLTVHQLNLEMGGYELFAYAPVHSVTPAEGEGGGWNVNSSRGSVRAAKVVFATNAYSDAVIPELKGLIIPTRAQAVKMSAAPAGKDACPRFVPSYSMRFMPKHFYSVATRPDGSIVLGTSRGWPGMPPNLQKTIFNTVDDSHADPVVTQNAVETFSKMFPQGGWSADGIEDGKAAGYEYAWSGIIGMTPDMAPFIGSIPDKPNQYIAAGYCGHGMARIFLTAPALAEYMMSGTWDPEMPEAFVITPERLERLRAKLREQKIDADGGDSGKLFA